MHDIDRALFETEAGWTGEGELEWPGETADREGELAAELLEITTEQEFDRFLGDLLDSAVSGARSFARSSAGRAVGGVLKSAARQTLPQIGRVLGDAVAPGVGGALGQRAGQWLGGQFELGLETEGLSAEDREYETAQAFVRFAQETAQRAARSDAGDPATAARQAATAAARQHLPGLAKSPALQPGSRRGTSGRWIRRGDRIVLLDL